MTEERAALRTRSRIAAYVLWDHLARQTVTKADEIPWGLEALTSEWLTAVLCCQVPAARVTGFEVLGGDSGSTVRRALAVSYEGDPLGELPRRIFVKNTPTLLTRLGAGQAGAVEARFYERLRGELDIEAPTLLHSASDPRSGRSLHLFEDAVAMRGAEFCRYTSQLQRPQVEQAVDTLAALHGRFYASKRLEDDLRWVPKHESFVRSSERVGVRLGHERAMERSEEIIPANVFRRRSEIWPAYQAAVGLHLRNPRTLIHSDVHLGNWYVTGDGRMGLADWQCLQRGHWARDLAYAVSTLCDEADRGRWERDLLERYLENMAKSCSLRVPFDEAWDAYRSQMMAALLMWTPTLMHVATMPDMQPEEMSRLMIRRTTVAIDELGSLDAETHR